MGNEFRGHFGPAEKRSALGRLRPRLREPPGRARKTACLRWAPSFAPRSAEKKTQPRPEIILNFAVRIEKKARGDRGRSAEGTKAVLKKRGHTGRRQRNKLAQIGLLACRPQAPSIWGCAFSSGPPPKTPPGAQLNTLDEHGITTPGWRGPRSAKVGETR